jgi:hypothetical protein
MKYKFRIEFEACGEVWSTAILELDEAVITAVDDDWRSALYPLETPEEIAEHIAANMILGNLTLNQMDGWADQPATNAKIIKWPALAIWEIKAIALP